MVNLLGDFQNTTTGVSNTAIGYEAFTITKILLEYQTNVAIGFDRALLEKNTSSSNEQHVGKAGQFGLGLNTTG